LILFEIVVRLWSVDLGRSFAARRRVAFTSAPLQAAAASTRGELNDKQRFLKVNNNFNRRAATAKPLNAAPAAINPDKQGEAHKRRVSDNKPYKRRVSGHKAKNMAHFAKYLPVLCGASRIGNIFVA
jgi:hypothetical protein